MTPLAFLVLLLLLGTGAHVIGQQPGFLSIDCGLDDKYSGYKDPDTGIFYVSDGQYTNAGENLKVAPEYESQWSRPYHTVRSFPSGVRNCYALPTVAGAKYLVRLEAWYGNYDGRNEYSASMETFDLQLGANYWATVYVVNKNVYEVLFVAWASWAPMCLLNTGHGTPFLSLLELRHLGDAMYPPLTANQTMSMYYRANMGGIRTTTRFPDDPYDRYWWWWAIVGQQYRNLSVAQSIQPDPSFVEPVVVLQTAATTATGNDTTLSYAWGGSPADSFMVFLHFADFQNAQAREMDIYLNGNRLGQSDKPYSPLYLASSSVYTSGWYRALDGYNLTLVKTAGSALPPMLNAMEIYNLLVFDTPTTFPKDSEFSLLLCHWFILSYQAFVSSCFCQCHAFVWCGNFRLETK